MKRIVVIALVLALNASLWCDTVIEYSTEAYEPEPVGSLQVEPTDAIIGIFTDNEFTDDGIDAKYLKLVRDYDFVPAGVKEDIATVIKEDPSSVLSKIHAQLKKHLVPGKIEYVYMLIGNRLFSATIGER